jgi:hypothetical protein
MRAREGDACSGKTDLNNTRSFERSEPINFPWLHERRRGGVGMKDACELSRWLPARARGAGLCRQRDSEAAGWNTRRSYISMNRAVGCNLMQGDGGDPFSAGPSGESENGAALNITALVFCPGKQGSWQTATIRRAVRAAPAITEHCGRLLRPVPACQRSRIAHDILSGRLDSLPGIVAPAR